MAKSKKQSQLPAQSTLPEGQVEASPYGLGKRKNIVAEGKTKQSKGKNPKN